MRRFRVAATLLLAAIFLYLTFRSFNQFFTEDDLMNTWQAWMVRPPRIVESLFLIWIPVYRPLGGLIYLIFYRLFGFNSLPLYFFSGLFLAVNAILAWRLFRELTGEVVTAFIALSLTLVHGAFAPDLYDNAGTIYDRLWFFFTLLGVLVYARLRSRNDRLTWRGALAIVLLSLAAMGSKEGGVTLPVLLGCYELTMVRIKRRWSQIVPLFVGLAILCVGFIFRVNRTSGMNSPAYAHHLTFPVWFMRVGQYMGMLFYHHGVWPAIALASVFVAMAAIALLLRNRVMLFGLLWFLVTITPLAAIDLRSGYVLYVPIVGLGLWAAAGLSAMLRTEARLMAAFFALTLVVFIAHARHWSPPRDSHYEPQYILAQQFRHDYPDGWPRDGRLLFANDPFSPSSWALFYTLSLLSHNRSLHVDRIDGDPAQQPDLHNLPHYERAFTYFDKRYRELDSRDLPESIRLNILQHYDVGRKENFTHTDRAAYIVSGVIDEDSSFSGPWISRHAELKFDLYPAPATFSVKYWLGDAAGPNRSLQLSVNGQRVGAVPLLWKGFHEAGFPVSADEITFKGFTIVSLDVSPVSKASDGSERGLVLLQAGFDYR